VPTPSRYLACEDEKGRSWIVYEGDTAWPACSTLAKLGLRDIVLPIGTYLSGSLHLPEMVDVTGLTPEMIEIGGEPVKTLVRRVVRLKDCVTYLAGLAEDGANALV